MKKINYKRILGGVIATLPLAVIVGCYIIVEGLIPTLIAVGLSISAALLMIMGMNLMFDK